ncbi:DUF2690 domain-containing protein [Sphaerisporangium sp. NPDC088356]|uniref:DUF2690 domain-containing protein n=1 Tax=Sphaerisporangium sp. NPDC088356 TaxID=3154871 RepID=UPI00342C9CD2
MVFTALIYRRSLSKPGETELALAGKISGKIPEGWVLYPYVWAGPNSLDGQENSSSGSFVVGAATIHPDENGCWALSKFRLAYAGVQAQTYRFYLGLASPEQQACVRRIERATGDVFSGDIQGCGVNMLGYAVLSMRPTSSPIASVEDNADPKTTGCTYDPQVATLDRVEIETAGGLRLGEVELRHSPQCMAAWGRFTPNSAMTPLTHARVRIVADRPATNTAGSAYEIKADGHEIFGNILSEKSGCVQITVTITADNVAGSAVTACKP